MTSLRIPIGSDVWTFEVPASKLLPVTTAEPLPADILDPAAAVREALEQPQGCDFPLRRALTPDDRVAIVVDDDLPQIGPILTGLIDHLGAAGIPPEAITLVTADDLNHMRWVDRLPDDFPEVSTEVHTPADRDRLSYLGTTKAGHRLYLNRIVVDADQTILVSRVGYDALLGYRDAEALVYPDLADAESRNVLRDKLKFDAAPTAPNAIRNEAREVSWLLGIPFAVRVYESENDGIAAISAALMRDINEDALRTLDRWRKGTIPKLADLVLVGISGEPSRHHWGTLAAAASSAVKVVKPGGTVVILSRVEPEMGEAFEALRIAADLHDAVREVRNLATPDRDAALIWAHAASKAHLYLDCSLNPQFIEELFATPIGEPEEVQRLLDAAESVVVLTDAHLRHVTPA